MDLILFHKNTKKVIQDFNLPLCPDNEFKYGIKERHVQKIIQFLGLSNKIQWAFFDLKSGYGYKKYGNQVNESFKDTQIDEYIEFWENHYPIKSCDICGKEFRALQPHQIYCSEECRRLTVYTKEKRGVYIIFERDNFRCFYCGRSSYKHNIELHCDHVYPKSCGGSYAASNLVTACEDCNRTKGSSIIQNIDDVYKEIKKRNKLHGISQNQVIKFY
jgi:predicted nucleic acid-binding Zn ribbon protein